jgi:hypothetical protein
MFVVIHFILWQSILNIVKRSVKSDSSIICVFLSFMLFILTQYICTVLIHSCMTFPHPLMYPVFRSMEIKMK